MNYSLASYHREINTYIAEAVCSVDQDRKAGEVGGLARDDCGATRAGHTAHLHPIKCPRPFITTMIIGQQNFYTLSILVNTYLFEKFQ